MPVATARARAARPTPRRDLRARWHRRCPCHAAPTARPPIHPAATTSRRLTARRMRPPDSRMIRGVGLPVIGWRRGGSVDVRLRASMMPFATRWRPRRPRLPRFAPRWGPSATMRSTIPSSCSASTSVAWLLAIYSAACASRNRMADATSRSGLASGPRIGDRESHKASLLRICLTVTMIRSLAGRHSAGTGGSEPRLRRRARFEAAPCARRGPSGGPGMCRTRGRR